jgi:hypothetical protein
MVMVDWGARDIRLGFADDGGNLVGGGRRRGMLV